MTPFPWKDLQRELMRDERIKSEVRRAQQLQNISNKVARDVQREAQPLGDMWQADTAPVRWLFSPVTNLFGYWKQCGQWGTRMARTGRGGRILYDVFRIFRGERRLF